MSSYPFNGAGSLDVSIFPDIKVVADGSEATGLVVTEQLLHRIVTITSGSGAVDDDEADRVRSIHQQSILHLGQQDALIEYLHIANHHGIGLLYHCCLVLKVRDTGGYTQSRQGGDNSLCYDLKDFHPIDFA